MQQAVYSDVLPIIRSLQFPSDAAVLGDEKIKTEQEKERA